MYVTLDKVIITKNCPKCGNKFNVERAIHNGVPHIKLKEKKFCNRKCANGHVVSNETKEKISTSLTGTEQNPNRKFPYRKNYNKKIICYCKKCGKELSKNCKTGLCWDCWIPNKNSYQDYKNKCQFKFNVYDYPNKFDLSLIDKYGWYLAFNRGNNLKGVSRDHVISINYGFKHNISSEIISHPANCKLILQNENSSKHVKCGMTLRELKKLIDNF